MEVPASAYLQARRPPKPDAHRSYLRSEMQSDTLRPIDGAISKALDVVFLTMQSSTSHFDSCGAEPPTPTVL
jgi:hypothetical protein